MPPGQLGRSRHHQTAPGWIKPEPEDGHGNCSRLLWRQKFVPIPFIRQKLLFLQWLIISRSEACFAASNMPEAHQEAFFLRIPCHISLKAQKKKRDLAKFFAERPRAHQLIFSPPSQNCQKTLVNLLRIAVMQWN